MKRQEEHCGTKMRLWGEKRKSGSESKDVLTAGGVIKERACASLFVRRLLWQTFFF